MAVDRPTFSESWYRVADLRPRLRASLQTTRQHFRGERWHVIQDPSNNQYYRLNEAAYRFVSLLDGQRTVSQVWRICNEELGDSAPTQGEAIQLLGQLYTSNLLQAELPPDAEGLFKRYRKRRQREVQGYLMNLLFIRIPLIDPDRFLNRWVGVIGKIFTVYGFAIWLGLLATGLYFVVGNIRELADRASAILEPEKLPLLYVAMIFVKVFHEFGHAFACKHFGLKEGGAGEVHTMGVMFLVFMPLPYMDATSVWQFQRSKWHRAVVAAAGMMVELAIASIAAVIWAKTAPGSTVNALCYNIIFIASVSTLLFNGNPLLRFDAYYILSDITEIANLSNRSKEYVYYLVKKYVWGVRQARNPAYTPGEKRWMVFYGIASTCYRVFICVRILMFVADKLFFVGALLAVMAAVAWVLTPLYKFVRYLGTSGELTRVRSRAVGTTAGLFALIVICIGLIPMPDRVRADAVAEPELAIVHAESDGYVRKYKATDQWVEAGEVLVQCENFELQRKMDQLNAQREELNVHLSVAREREGGDATAIQTITDQLEAVDLRRQLLQGMLDGLTVRASLAGRWVAPKIEWMDGVYVKRGEQLGVVARFGEEVLRAIAEQGFPIDQICVGQEVGIRLRGRPDDEFRATITEIRKAATKQLPSPALGYAAGGSIRTARDDRRGMEAAERVFEIRITPVRDADGRIRASGKDKRPVHLKTHQRVVVRFSLRGKPLAVQWWQSIRRLVLRRFRV